MRPQELIADVARRDVGFRETSHNRAPWIAKFWTMTWYEDGMLNREPYCAAAVCYWVHIADNESPDLKFRNPPMMPAVKDWVPWASKPENGCIVFTWDPKNNYKPSKGDIVVFNWSHIGIVDSDPEHDEDGWFIYTIEANTDEDGSREGNGVFRKKRYLRTCGYFIRLPAIAKNKSSDVITGEKL